MAETINVLIDDEGNVEITTTGFTGSACQKATAELERALGRKTSDAPTAEARAVPSVNKVKAGR